MTKITGTRFSPSSESEVSKFLARTLPYFSIEIDIANLEANIILYHGTRMFGVVARMDLSHVFDKDGNLIWTLDDIAKMIEDAVKKCMKNYIDDKEGPFSRKTKVDYIREMLADSLERKRNNILL